MSLVTALVFFRFTTAFVNKNWRFPLLASVDLTELCCVDPVGEGLIEFLWEKFRLFNFPLIVEIQARHWRLSWRELEKLLDKSQSISLIVTSDEQPGNEGLYDLLTVRNDIDIERVFYKVNGTTLTSFKDLASTAGSPLLYFDVHPRDAGKIIWSHNTDTWELLDDAVKGNFLFTGARAPQLSVRFILLINTEMPAILNFLLLNRAEHKIFLLILKCQLLLAL